MIQFALIFSAFGFYIFVGILKEYNLNISILTGFLAACMFIFMATTQAIMANIFLFVLVGLLSKGYFKRPRGKLK